MKPGTGQAKSISEFFLKKNYLAATQDIRAGNKAEQETDKSYVTIETTNIM